MQPKLHAKFHELPISAIEPQGWIRQYLEKQRHGLTGHIEAAGYPFNTAGWGSMKHITGGTEGWWPYEQTGYWVDGAVRCGHLLRDSELVKKAAHQIEFAIAHADTDGFIGMRYLKKPLHNNRWPHTVFFRALMAHYDATGDKQILNAIRRHYLSGTSTHSASREVTNIETILWAYRHTGDKRLLRHAEKAYALYNKNQPDADTSVQTMLSPRRPAEHGVTYNEIAKLGAIMYTYTGNKQYLDASVNAFQKLDARAMLIDGVHSSSEHIQGKDPLDSHETCVIADHTWSLGYLLMATGDGAYADKIERAIFNAAPGAVHTHDLKALQYFSSPNQVLATANSNHNVYHCGDKWMSYRPNPGTECCAGNVNRIMPNFAARMWMSDGSGGLAAVMYSPCRLTTTVGQSDVKVTIVEETNYPFSGRIDLCITPERPVRFALHLRIPSWCKKPQLSLNDEKMPLPPMQRSFIKIDRLFQPSDRITLILPMQLTLSNWPRGGVGIERGPLVYALRIIEEWYLDTTEKRQTKDFPAYNLLPASPWNYALSIDGQNINRVARILRMPQDGFPWTIDTTPIAIEVPARRVRGWNLKKQHSVLSAKDGANIKDAKRVDGEFLLTPQLPEPKTLAARLSKKTEQIILVPYGCTHLRVTIFPQVKTKKSGTRRKRHRNSNAIS